MKAVRGEEIFLITENKIVKLDQITKIIKDNNVNIRAINAYSDGIKAYFRLLTSNNTTTKEILKKFGTVESKDVIIVDMPDEIGQLHILASKLKEANVDITYMYGTAATPKGSAIVVFSSGDNNKALEALS
ncbi:MAG: hypothetical protein NC935_00380 [Candidatus Omnitrophica bacterium]|nr:hypothetical protein [Candidatus Omnitrophota bacterium]